MRHLRRSLKRWRLEHPRKAETVLYLTALCPGWSHLRHKNAPRFHRVWRRYKPRTRLGRHELWDRIYRSAAEWARQLMAWLALALGPDAERVAARRREASTTGPPRPVESRLPAFASAP